MANVPSPQNSSACDSCGCGSHSHPGSGKSWKKYAPSFVSFFMLALGLVFDFLHPTHFFSGTTRLIWYIAAYLPVGIPIIQQAWEAMRQKDFFNEFTLMVLATLGAFFIGEFPEGVAVMLFYSVGELFQGSAVQRARGHIKSLLDLRPETASLYRNGEYVTVTPEEVTLGEIIQVKAGEKVPLDGELLTASGNFNTSALTGESVPRILRKGETVLAGMINLDQVCRIQVTKKYSDSSLSKILELVQQATSRKAPTELLVRKFARIYTPVVFTLALAITVLPYFFVGEYHFSEWLYRALVFLVISCPCALVVSIPLSYFGGIGAASRHGILFKGANYLERMTQVNTVVMDKTGTLTEGVFQVIEALPFAPGHTVWLEYGALLEQHSTHPVAKAVRACYSGKSLPDLSVSDVKEIAGKGLVGKIQGHEIGVGNTQLFKQYGIRYPETIDALHQTVALVSADGIYRGHFVVADRLKKDAAAAVQLLRKEGITHTVMLSGDQSSLVREMTSELQIDEAYGNLLPVDKVRHLERIKAVPSRVVAFVGDGINDAPVLALSDIGIAMGGMGTDVAIEVADVIIQTDEPSRIATALQIAKTTRRIVIQNIVLALGIKAAILVLDALGIATMWEAVFADVGVSLLAILNAVRILKKRF